MGVSSMSSVFWRVVCVGVLVALCAACQTAPRGNDLRSDIPEVEVAARHLAPGQKVSGKLRANQSSRERYLVKIPQKGLLSLRVSWTRQEGLDRVLLQRGQRGEVETLVARDLLKMEHRTAVSPGYYYVELVPGREATSYTLVVDFSP